MTGMGDEAPLKGTGSRRHNRRVFCGALLSGAVAGAIGCRGPQRVEVAVLAEETVGPLFRELAGRFQSNHPAVGIRPDFSAGLEFLRRVAEAGRACDLAAGPDEQLLGAFLFPAGIRQAWAFLGDEIVLASARAESADSRSDRSQWRDGWVELVFEGDYSLGAADPQRDSCGYHAQIVWKLAEISYGRPGLYRKLLSRFEKQWKLQRPSELISQLRAGQLDFAFLYKSAALQNDLRFVALPPQISLGEASYADSYAQAFLRVPSPLDPSSTLEIQGRPIRHWIAQVSPDAPSAQDFLRYCLADESLEIARGMGYTRIDPVEVAPPRSGL